jgi:predicted DNA-binding transcriptional regulator AlpA
MQSVATIPEALGHTRLIDIDDLKRKTSRARSTIYRWIEMGILPRQAKKPEGTTSALWWEDEVDAAMEALRQSPVRQFKKPEITDQVQGRTIAQKLISLPAEQQRPTQLSAQHNKRQPNRRQEKEDRHEIHVILERSSLGSREVFLDRLTGTIFAVVGQVQMFEPAIFPESPQHARRTGEAGGGP